MRILHTSDWHLGQHLMGKTRQAEHAALIDWLVQQVQTHQVDAVILAGDVFDTTAPPSYARELYNTLVLRLHDAHCQLVVLAGNHDSVATLQESSHLLQRLGTHVITTAHTDDVRSQILTLHNRHGQPAALLCAVPFVRARDVLRSQAGESADDKRQNLQQAIATHYQQLYDTAQEIAQEIAQEMAHKMAHSAACQPGLPTQTMCHIAATPLQPAQQVTPAAATHHNGAHTHAAPAPRLPIIATGHLTMVGARSSESVRDIYIGTLEAFPASALPPFDYVALGHIHRPQRVGGQAHIRYCGAPLALGFDEAGQTRQVLLVDIDRGIDAYTLFSQDMDSDTPHTNHRTAHPHHTTPTPTPSHANAPISTPPQLTHGNVKRGMDAHTLINQPTDSYSPSKNHASEGDHPTQPADAHTDTPTPGQPVRVQVRALAVPIFQPMTSVSGTLDELQQRLPIAVEQARALAQQSWAEASAPHALHPLPEDTAHRDWQTDTVPSPTDSVQRATATAEADASHPTAPMPSIPPVWLEVVVQDDAWRSDLQPHIQALADGLPAEILRIRRMRPGVNPQLAAQPRQTLDDLQPEEVFTRRLACEAELDEAMQAQLWLRYRQVLDQVRTDTADCTADLTPHSDVLPPRPTRSKAGQTSTQTSADTPTKDATADVVSDAVSHTAFNATSGATPHAVPEGTATTAPASSTIGTGQEQP